MLRSVQLPTLEFATPRKLPKPKEVQGRVVVVDVAFASEASGGGFQKITLPFIQGLGNRLAAWVDHHDHAKHVDYARDPRFVLATKAQHGACPEMITEEIVQRAGRIDSIVCHTDFDGLASAAKWIRGGAEPYPGCDADARAIDTRMGVPGPFAVRMDRAIRARYRDRGLLGLIVRHLATGLEDKSLWSPIDEAAQELERIETKTRQVAERYRIVEAKPGGVVRNIAFADATDMHGQYDKTMLLLMGQERAHAAVLVDRDTLSLAAPFDSGINFLNVMGLSGGMPTLVSVPKTQLAVALARLGIGDNDARPLIEAVG
jgi:hypothetical protein